MLCEQSPITSAVLFGQPFEVLRRKPQSFSGGLQRSRRQDVVNQTVESGEPCEPTIGHHVPRREKHNHGLEGVVALVLLNLSGTDVQHGTRPTGVETEVDQVASPTLGHQEQQMELGALRRSEVKLIGPTEELRQAHYFDVASWLSGICVPDALDLGGSLVHLVSAENDCRWCDFDSNVETPSRILTCTSDGESMAHDRRSILGAIPALAAAALWSGESTAQQASSVEELIAVNRAFDEALSRLNMTEIEALSLQEPQAMAIHPSARQIMMGWDAVRGSWQAVVERFAELSVKLENARAVVRDNVGWVSGTEFVAGKRKSGEAVTYSALTTNIFEKRNGRWLMSAHITARLSPQSASLGTSTLQAG